MNKEKTTKPEEQKENEELWELCKKTYEELRAIDIPVQMPEKVVYRNLRTYWGHCEVVYLNYDKQTDTWSEKIVERISIIKALKNEERLKRMVMAHELLHTIKPLQDDSDEFYELSKKAEKAYHYGLFDTTNYLDVKNRLFLYQCYCCGRYFYLDRVDMAFCKCCDTMNIIKKKIDFRFLDMERSEYEEIAYEEARNIDWEKVNLEEFIQTGEDQLMS